MAAEATAGSSGRSAGYAGGPVTGRPGLGQQHGTPRSKRKEEDWTVFDALKQGLLREEFPATVDHRKEEAEWNDIMWQGDTSSCVGWASTDSVLRWHLIKANRLDKPLSLSARFTWMASKETDKDTAYPETFIENAGTPLKAALNVLKKYGCVPEEDFPFYSALRGTTGLSMVRGIETQEFYAKAAQYRLKSYYSLVIDEKPNVDHLRMWISQQGPLLVMSDLDGNFRDLYHGKTTLDTYDTSTVVIDRGHAFALVGYTPEHFIIRNTWGTAWGDKGYAYATNAYVAAAICEGYGICI